MSVCEIPTLKRIKNQSSTPYRTVQDALDKIDFRNQDNAGLYYLQHNWLFCDFWGVFTPTRQEVTVHQIPGIPPARWREFSEACNRYRNTAVTVPVTLEQPTRLETYTGGKFIGTPRKSDRRWLEEWISYEVYPVRGSVHQLNRKAVDSIRRLSGCRKLAWHATELDGVYCAIHPTTGEALGIISAIVPNK